MKSKNLILIAGILIILTVIGIMWGAISNSNRAVAGRREPWPAFTLVYDVVWHPHGLAQPAASETWKVEYTDTNHWRAELIASTNTSSQVGFWASFDGEVYRTYSPTLDHIEETKVEHWTVPNDWLVPGLISSMEEKGYQLAGGQADSNSIAYTRAEPFECNVGPPTCLRADQTSYTWTTEITFSKEFGIPVEVVDKTDGQISRHIIVTELTLKE